MIRPFKKLTLDNIFYWCSFVALDATLKTGVKKVFNFLGQITSEDMTAVLEDKMKFTSYKQVWQGYTIELLKVGGGVKNRQKLGSNPFFNTFNQ